MALNFKHSEPRKYYYKLENWLGEPSIVGEDVVGWEKSVTENLSGTPYLRIVLKDEYVAHNFPAKHHDYVYSYAKLKMTAEKACSLVKVSGSILIDLLKNEVGARCGSLTANDVTLSFVEDVITGKTKATKQEYSRRIKNSIVTRAKYNAHKRIKSASSSEECIIC